MNKGMSRKPNGTNNNTFSAFTNMNKFAVLRGERPKSELEKKPEKKQDWKSTNTKKSQPQQVQKKVVTETYEQIDEQHNENHKHEQVKNEYVNDEKRKFFDPNQNNDNKYENKHHREQRDHKKEFTTGEVEQKKLYIDTLDNSNEMGNTMFLNSPWTVWIHKADCQVWTEESYTNIYVVNSIGSFWRFFNNFHALDKVRNQFFIMRNKIKPIWEDNDNRNGGICSIKLDCYSKQGRIDIGVEIMMCVCLLVMNETLVQANEEINGISYSIKNRSVLIKLWCKNFTNKIAEKLPIGLFSKLDTMMRNMDRDRGNFNRKPLVDNKISIRYTQIKPEYDVE